MTTCDLRRGPIEDWDALHALLVLAFADIKEIALCGLALGVNKTDAKPYRPVSYCAKSQPVKK